MWGQDIWQDYILGRPAQGLVAAKKAVAQKWGIQYKAILAGCLLNEETSQKMEDYQKANQAYLDKIATKYGENWLDYFNLEVNIECLKKNNYIKGKWIEPILMNEYYKELYEKKKDLATSWGLEYEALPIDDPKTMTAEDSKKIALGNPYIQQINGSLGENWVQAFEANFATIKQKHQSNIPETWKEYLLEDVDEKFYHTKQKVLADWGIQYEPYFVACCKNKDKKMREGNYATKANSVQNKISAVLGKTWKDRLQIAIQKRMLAK